MKKIISIGLALILSLALAAPVLAAATVYTDKSAWEAAVGAYVTEDFSDATLNPGVSVDSDLGEILVDYGLWWDQLNYSGGPTTFTTWTFAAPICAFGGTWDAGSDREYDGHEVGGPGSNIEVLMDGSWVSVGVIDNEYIDQFWGFVSDVPFNQVRLQAYNDEGWTERYTLDDMVYSFVRGKVTGGGYIKDENGKKNLYSLSGNTMVDKSGGLKGNWVIRDFANEMTYHLDTINSLDVGGLEAETPYAPYRAFTIKASGSDQEGNYVQATIVIKDIQEPGKGSDILQLWVMGAYLIQKVPIDGGDFQAHMS